MGVGLLIGLSACSDGAFPNPFKGLRNADKPAESATAPTASNTQTRDVESPEVFSVTETALWDGRPSLGGVWVAHPDVDTPERVIIRNPDNGKSVIGALFRRERANPGPRLQASSDAADALGMLAGQPRKLSVVALRAKPVAAPAPAALPKAEDVSEGALPPADIATSAAAAITAAEVPAAPPAPQAPAPAKPFIQLGLFSIEKNASSTVAEMKSARLPAQKRKLSSNGKTFWKVTVGPAGSAAERDEFLSKVKAKGFADAYAVSN